ncbi:MAG: DivIVA domain-containing protein, partial [Acidimicrobiales bacterium]
MAIQSDHEFAPTQIARAVFPTAFRGYDQDAVRRYLSRLASALEHQQEYAGLGELEARTPAHERVEELEAEVENLRDEIKDLELELVEHSVKGDTAADDESADGEAGADTGAFDEHRAIELLGQETARVLESARSAAADILKRAETQAASLKAQAKSELAEARRRAETMVAEKQAATHELVERLTADAEANAERINTEADEHRAAVLKESSKILAEAETLSETEQADAELRAKQIVADAETLRQQVISELVVERRQAQTEMDRMTSARDRLAMSLAVARSELDEVADALVDVAPVRVPADPTDLDFSADPTIIDPVSPADRDVPGDEAAGAEPPIADAGDDQDRTEGDPVGGDRVDASSEAGAQLELDAAPVSDRSDDESAEPATSDRPDGSDPTSGSDEHEDESRPDDEVIDLRDPEPATAGPTGTGSKSKSGSGSGSKAKPRGKKAKPAAATKAAAAKSGKANPSATKGRGAVATAELDREKSVEEISAVDTVDMTEAELIDAVTVPDRPAEPEADPVGDPSGGAAVVDTEPDGDSANDIELELQLDTGAGQVGLEINEPPLDGESLSLVEGFTTIELNDGADSKPAEIPADQQETPDADRRSDGEPGQSSEEDDGAELVYSVLVNEPQTPSDVITTVASRTATSQPDRTRGDLLLDEQFTGRLPKEFGARDRVLARSGPNFRRQLRRALNDDQSEVLDLLRAGRGPIKVDELPGFGDQIDRYLAPLRRGLAEIAQAGAKAGGRNELSQSALDNLVRQLAKYIVDKVRIPTIQVLQETADHDRER